MAIQSLARGHYREWVSEETHPVAAPRHFRFLPGIVLLTFLCLLIHTASVVVIARLEPIMLALDLPPEYLPGNPMPVLPEDTYCSPSVYDVPVPCNFQLSGTQVDLSYWMDTRVIVYSAIAIHNYRIGDLIAAWGSPTGIIQRGRSTYLYWGTREALIYTDFLRPDSPVDTIGAYLDPPKVPAWKGFVTYLTNDWKSLEGEPAP